MGNWYMETGPEQDVVISSRVRLARNFKQFPFNAMATRETSEKLLSFAADAIAKSGTEDFQLVRMNELPILDKEYLVETHVISMDLAQKKLPCAVGIRAGSPLSVMVNEEDHLRIQSILPGLQMEISYQSCLELERLPPFQEQYAFSYEFGYLTSCPTNTGTAIRASAMLHLPALVLSDQINDVLEACGRLGIAVRGIYGENSSAMADCFQISNQVTLGQSEEDILHSVNNIIQQVCRMERNGRTTLLEKGGVRLEDRLCRAFGILTNARTISSEEALQLLSQVKMGVELGILKGLSSSDLIVLMIHVQPACLQKITGKLLTPEERDMERARMIREKLTIGGHGDGN